MFTWNINIKSAAWCADGGMCDKQGHGHGLQLLSLWYLKGNPFGTPIHVALCILFLLRLLSVAPISDQAQAPAHPSRLTAKHAGRGLLTGTLARRHTFAFHHFGVVGSHLGRPLCCSFGRLRSVGGSDLGSVPWLAITGGWKHSLAPKHH